MSKDADQMRPATKDWRAYLTEMKEEYGVYKWVLSELISPQSWYWIKRMFVAMLIGTGLTMAQSWILSFVFDGIVSRNLQLVLIGSGTFVSVIVLEMVAHNFQMRYREWVLGANIGQLDKRTNELFLEKSMGQHLNEGGTLSSANVEKGRGRVMEVENMMIFNGLPVLIEISFCYLFLWILSPVAGAILTISLVNYFIWLIFLNQRVNKVMAPLDAEFRRLNRRRIDIWENIERVKTTGREAEEIDSQFDWFVKIIDKDRSFWLWFINMCSIRGFTNMVVLFAVMGYGIWNVWSGAWTIGLLYPLFAWSRYISMNLWRIGEIEHQLNWNMPSVKSMKDALTMDVDLPEGAIELSINGAGMRIEFDNVTHSYPVNSKDTSSDEMDALPVLKGVSFTIEPHEKVALIGPSGSGKTTVMRLLQRYMIADGGSVRVEGVDLVDVRAASWTDCLGYIPQQSQVLDGTIASNLVYGLSSEQQEEVDDSFLWRIMQTLQIDFGKRLTHGLKTKVGRNGLKLSGGQAQRLMIGAAAVRQPKFMVIDEATSSLDSSTEIKVQKGLAKVLGDDMGALIVTHRLSAVRELCDKFIVLCPAETLKDGDSQVEAIAGSFEDLYEISSTFRQLADDQGVKMN